MSRGQCSYQPGLRVGVCAIVLLALSGAAWADDDDAGLVTDELPAPVAPPVAVADIGGTLPVLAMPPDASTSEAGAGGVPAGYEPGWFPGLMSILPGILLHGSGVYAAGDPDTALDLLALEGIGVGLFAAGGAAIVLTGASRRIVGWATPTLIAGLGLFTQTWFSDIYGSVADGGLGTPLRTASTGEVRAGYRYIYDPQFAFRNFATLFAEGRIGSVALDASGWFALDDDNQRIRSIFSYRFLGPDAAPERVASSGSHLEAQAGGNWHNNGTEGFYTVGFEAFVDGRLDLAEIGAVLRGAFAEMGVGWGIDIYDYDVEGLEFGEDVGELLLFRFGWGLYLGGDEHGHGEAMIYYDHRHDGYAAGLGLGGLGGGPAGHFGLEGRWFFWPDEHGDAWGLVAEAVVGSAYIVGLDVAYRWGGRL